MGDLFRYIKNKFFSSRTSIIVFIFLMSSIVLISRLFYLQIIKGSEYQENYTLLTKRNMQISATSGNIYDVNGKVLATNELSYAVTIKDVGTYESTKEKNKKINSMLNQIITNLERLGNSIDIDFGIIMNSDGTYEFKDSGTSEMRFRADIFGHTKTSQLTQNDKAGLNEATCTAEELMNYLYSDKKYNISKKYDAATRYKIAVIRYNMGLNYYQQYLSTTIASDVNQEGVAYIKENSADFIGVDIEDQTKRVYTNAECFSNIIGYTGKISKDEYDALIAKDPDNDKKYDLTDTIGKAGIEQYANDVLCGTKGKESVFVDHLGNEISVESHTDAVSGGDVYLSIDSDLQVATYKLLEKEIAGIVYSKLANIKEYNNPSGNSDILIPVYDAYVSFLKNGLINVKQMNDPDATDLEKTVYAKLSSKVDSATDELINELSTGGQQNVYSNLPEEYQDYSTYTIRMLKNKNILDKDKIDENDETQKAWEAQSLSVKDYLAYCISMNWIDTTKYVQASRYSDNEELLNNLLDYIRTEFAEDSAYKKICYEYAVKQDIVSGNELCAILYDQGILSPDDATRNSLADGSISAYNFLKDKIKSLEITPAQLALDPCSGSCVIIDPNTGATKALVSYPGYDTNRLANKVDTDYYLYLNTTAAAPMYNHATQQLTAPGSTFKPISATAGMAEGVISTGTPITDEGIFTKVSNQPRCWIYTQSHTTHGSINVSEALRDSCNYFFYEVGWRLAGGANYNDKNGISKIQKYATMYGLNRKTGVEIEENTPHIATEYPVMAAIGQSDNNYTTISLARYATALASSGNVYKLSVLDHSADADGNTIGTYGPSLDSTVDCLDSAEWGAIHSGMRMVVENLSVYDEFPIEVSGKTGTAQESKNRPNHALFICYAPSSSPQIAVCTRIPFGYTSHNAAEVTRNIVGYYFKVPGYDNIDTVDAFSSNNANGTGD